MKRIAAVLMWLMASTAYAGLAQNELDGVFVGPDGGARLPLDLKALDDAGHAIDFKALLRHAPAFFIFTDYTCTTLCGVDVHLLAVALQSARLPAYQIVVFGLDPKDPPEAARAFADKEIDHAQLDHVTLLLPDAASVARAATALNFHYAYDAEVDQFAHPAVIYALNTDGAVLHAFSPFLLSNDDLEKVLAPATPPTGVSDRLYRVCYAYDPITGRYTLRIVAILRILAGLAALAVFGAIGRSLYLRRQT